MTWKVARAFTLRKVGCFCYEADVCVTSGFKITFGDGIQLLVNQSKSKMYIWYRISECISRNTFTVHFILS